MTDYYNPFQSLELHIPEVHRGAVDRYSLTQPTGGRRPSPDDSPFPRVVDIWFLAVCLGAARGRGSPLEDGHKFNTGDILTRDPGRVELLELIAISASGDPDIISTPAECMRLINGLAAAGLPEVLQMLESGNSKPIWNLTDSLLDRLERT